MWDYWKINSRKNLLDLTPDDEIETLRREIFDTRLGKWCHAKLDEWTAFDKPTQNGSIEFFKSRGRTDVRRVAYSQAWKYLFEKQDMVQLYRHLSMHCHASCLPGSSVSRSGPSSTRWLSCLMNNHSPRFFRTP